MPPSFQARCSTNRDVGPGRSVEGTRSSLEDVERVARHVDPHRDRQRRQHYPTVDLPGTRPPPCRRLSDDGKLQVGFRYRHPLLGADAASVFAERYRSALNLYGDQARQPAAEQGRTVRSGTARDELERPAAGPADLVAAAGAGRLARSGRSGLWAAMVEGAIVRTRFFDDYLLEVCAAGCRQVVLLAAGLDMRAFRLVWPDHVRLFEVDLPVVYAFKEPVIAERGHVPMGERVVVEADLRRDWHRRFVAAGFDVQRGTAWLAEGLLIYLRAGDKNRLLDDVGVLSAPGSRLAFDHLSQTRLEYLRDAAEAGRRRPGAGGPTTWCGRTSRSRGPLPRHRSPVGQQAAPLWQSGLGEEPASWVGRHGWEARVHDGEEQACHYGRQHMSTGDHADEAGLARLVTAHRRSKGPNRTISPTVTGPT